MERVPESKTWSVKNAPELYEVISEILRRDFPLDVFKGISAYSPCDDRCEVTAVLFLVCPRPRTHRIARFEDRTEYGEGELGIALNKRSRYVIQPGDLCFPGGGVKEPFDRLFSYLTIFLKGWLSGYPSGIRRILSLLSVTALREAWEEIGLNPFRVKICGVLPPHRLVMFHKIIVPIVGLLYSSVIMRTDGHEVEKIVWIPFSELLDPTHYARYRLYNYPYLQQQGRGYQDFLCFIHQDGVATEILWGATFRMVMDFIGRFFDFFPPPPETLPVVPGVLSDSYLMKRKLP